MQLTYTEIRSEVWADDPSDLVDFWGRESSATNPFRLLNIFLQNNILQIVTQSSFTQQASLKSECN